MAPDSPDARYALGDLLVDARQPREAETEYRRALRLQPGSSAGHVKLAETLRLQGKFPEAVAELREALHRQSNAVRAHSDLALVLRAQKNNPEAIAEYQEALRLDPDYIDAHNGLAVTLASRGAFLRRSPNFARSSASMPIRPSVLQPCLCVGGHGSGRGGGRGAPRSRPHQPAPLQRPLQPGRAVPPGRQVRRVGQAVPRYLRLAPDTPQTQRNRQRAGNFITSFENPD